MLINMSFQIWLITKTGVLAYLATEYSLGDQKVYHLSLPLDLDAGLFNLDAVSWISALRKWHWVWYFDITDNKGIVLKMVNSGEVNCLTWKNFSRRTVYSWKSSILLWSAPSTHRGSRGLGRRAYSSFPWCKPITWSSVPWITRVGDWICSTLSMLKGN